MLNEDKPLKNQWAVTLKSLLLLNFYIREECSFDIMDVSIIFFTF